MSELTQECVRSLFDYRDGELYWKVSRGNGMKIGDLAGTVRTDGYRSIQINGKLYLAHRLIFLYHYGYIPKEIDHIDSNPSNNNISNLREATRAQNHMNQKRANLTMANRHHRNLKGFREINTLENGRLIFGLAVN